MRRYASALTSIILVYSYPVLSGETEKCGGLVRPRLDKTRHFVKYILKKKARILLMLSAN